MEKLVVLSDDESPQEFPLVDKRLLIGRDATCDVCLGDRSVSRHHATLLRVFRGFSIEDEGSTNGTRVNGDVITKRFLKHGDLIEIGKYNLRYIAQLPHHEMEEEDPDRTVVIKPVQTTPAEAAATPAQPIKPAISTTPVADDKVTVAAALSAEKPAMKPAAPSTAPSGSPAQNGTAKVRFLEGDHKGEERVIDRSFFSVGKPGGDLILINHRHNGYYLLKVGGDNVPMINGKPIKAGGVELSNGDRITLGELSLEFVD
ncbi:MAG: FHA domain-containing protein [Candidatus Thiodiazotropha lotti]|uniref:FHA domain-containing protein n=1 Tax=Candidatus Thiodiazotropha endoloripes TaxID=1818881 RepID=A0A1E2UHG3_9GAMM|nr:FHA domain-containing protein [Candidatus Thiodiazotropha endoloripes]MCG7900592.1 FHA domain-containing protein [Candidatus Thiodiazotropha weberae]MCG7993115.1 FHA domain-containing protein [Candidatus Thiodiazotropha lotti]MCG7913526.1 FHA domain-containing protein [Candidatus Thiodiazotropha weberae]MCG8000250.1 FHA domain-containing protein [Candidatus Thiodiazotropha lotti]MCW4184777.1 FHA domain-containing protein [Candidatus Thiodiazotropha weberae]